jgi:hypothetical protein
MLFNWSAGLNISIETQYHLSRYCANYNLRFQEKNSNQNRESNPGPLGREFYLAPEMEPGQNNWKLAKLEICQSVVRILVKVQIFLFKSIF